MFVSRSHRVTAWPLKWSECWRHTPQGAALFFFSHHSVKVCWPVSRSLCPWTHSCLLWVQIPRPGEFCLCAVRERVRWPPWNRPVWSAICRLRCQDSPPSFLSRGHSLRVTSLVGESRPCGRARTIRRRHRSVNCRSLLCVASDSVDVRVGGCGWARDLGSESVELKGSSRPLAHPAGGWRRGREREGDLTDVLTNEVSPSHPLTGSPAGSRGLAAGGTCPRSLDTWREF